MAIKTLNKVARILRAVWALLVAMVRFLARLVGILAEGTKVPNTNDATNHAVRGGVLNYRTGKLDDGTDPYGWYERD
ncbi:MAG: hypothetical protein AB2598_16830 [Candidatus Thiodiazotropha sp.]